MTFLRLVFFVSLALIVLSPLLKADAKLLFWKRKHRRRSFIAPHKISQNDDQLQLLLPNNTLPPPETTKTSLKNSSIDL